MLRPYRHVDMEYMPEPLVYLLLLLALVLPMLSAIGLRALLPRLGERMMLASATALFGVACIAALALGSANVSGLRVAGLSLLLPSTRFSDDFAPSLDLPIDGVESFPTPNRPPTRSPQPSPSPTLTATAPPTATARPTSEPPSPTVEPPSPTVEPPSPTVAAATPRLYTVEPGDSLRSIAERFAVSVEDLLQANDLTPAQADALRPGQELIIP